ncbi:MAG: DUF6438 domain-containing protein [Chitinophagales bacterium]
MKRLIKLLSLVFFQLSCKPHPIAIEQIEFSTGPCYGMCPIFSIIINKDKTATYDAGSFNTKMGSFSALMNTSDYDSLIHLLIKSNILSLRKNYAVSATDQPTANLTVKFSNGMIKKIKDYGEAGTQQLADIYDFIFQLRNTQNWKLVKSYDSTANMDSTANSDSTKIIDSLKLSNAFKKTLKKKHLPGASFYLSLPDNYFITEISHPEFEIYYFSPKDKKIDSDFSGCIYLGFDNPQFNLKKFDFSKGFYSESDNIKFNPDNDTCNRRVMNGHILDTTLNWTVSECKGKYYLQANADGKFNWATKIVLFGEAKSEEEINKLLTIFSTLQHR